MTTKEITTKLSAILCCDEFSDVKSILTLAVQLREIADAAENMYNMRAQHKCISVTDEA